MELVCPICGEEFTSSYGNTKYCSQVCRIKGQKITRKKWEEQTHYKEKQRIKASEARAKLSALALQDEKKSAKRLRDAEKRVRRKKEKEDTEALNKKACEGDKRAQLIIALKSGDTLGYWRLRKEIALQEDERHSHISNTTVGNVNIYDDGFEYQVVEYINDRKNTVNNTQVD